MSHQAVVLAAALFAAACTPAPPLPPTPTAPAPAQSVLLITIDTLRADHVGAYGATTAHTPTLDTLARDGARFDKAWATAPITLTSHASLLSGRYPPGHRARHNGMALDPSVPTLATVLKAAGFQTAAFVSAFPLDRRFGLQRGFDVYDDQLPRTSAGRPLNERSGADTALRAITWLQAHRTERFFLWVHFFEPHAPYGDPSVASTPALVRYDDEVTSADREAGRVLAALGDAATSTLVVAAADHGEAFGEHGEIGHSIFVYDTTLRVPLLMRGPGVPAGAVMKDDVSLVDVLPTVMALVGAAAIDGDGRSLVAAIGGGALDARVIYAESFAPLLDFGWAGLRAVRDGSWKYIDAPKPELYDLSTDPAELSNRVGADPARVARFQTQASRWPALGGPAEQASASPAPDAVSRLRALGYVGGASPTNPSVRPDPKDRIALASRLATVTSGEVHGDALISTLEAILRDDPQNPQAHLRLGFAEMEKNRCDRAEPHLRVAAASGVPSADAGLGLAECRGRAGDVAGAERALASALKAEPENPVVIANMGLLALQRGRFSDAIPQLRRALELDAGLLEARFGLARALAQFGDRVGALVEARRLFAQLPAGAPQRAEVERLITALK